MPLHIGAVAIRDARARQARDRAVEETRVPGVDDPARGRLANDFAEAKRAMAFREILRVAERMLVRDEHGRLLERALPEDRTRGGSRLSAQRHVEEGAAGEHV